MKIKDSVLVLKDEVNDDMLEEFMTLVNKKKVKSIKIDTDNIGSLVVQQLFCINKSKQVICDDPFLAKFFDDVRYVA